MLSRIDLMLLLFLGACASCRGEGLDAAGFRQIGQSVAKLTIMTSEGIVLGSGTAWAITDEHLITAGHICIAQDAGLTMVVKGHRVQAIHRSKSADVCVLSGNPGMEPLKVRRHRIFEGERVYVIGHPVGAPSTITEGIAGQLVRLPPPLGLNRQISAPAFGGNSGGPVVDKQGLVVGILVAGVPRYPHLSYSVPHSRLLEAIDHAR